jgi:hypothetical protein
MIAILLGLIFGFIILTAMLSVMILPIMFWRAFVMSKMWLWFIVPIFNVIPIGWIACIGLTAFIGLFMKHDMDKVKADFEQTQQLPFNEQMTKLFHNISASFMIPLITLFIGWLTKDYVLAAIVK